MKSIELQEKINEFNKLHEQRYDLMKNITDETMKGVEYLSSQIMMPQQPLRKRSDKIRLMPKRERDFEKMIGTPDVPEEEKETESGYISNPTLPKQPREQISEPFDPEEELQKTLDEFKETRIHLDETKRKKKEDEEKLRKEDEEKLRKMADIQALEKKKRPVGRPRKTQT